MPDDSHVHKDGKCGESPRSPSDCTGPWAARSRQPPRSQGCSNRLLSAEQAEVATNKDIGSTAHLLVPKQVTTGKNSSHLRSPFREGLFPGVQAPAASHYTTGESLPPGGKGLAGLGVLRC